MSLLEKHDGLKQRISKFTYGNIYNTEFIDILSEVDDNELLSIIEMLEEVARIVRIDKSSDFSIPVVWTREMTSQHKNHFAIPLHFMYAGTAEYSLAKIDMDSLINVREIIYGYGYNIECFEIHSHLEGHLLYIPNDEHIFYLTIKISKR